MPWKAEGSTGNKQNLNLSADAFTVMQMETVRKKLRRRFMDSLEALKKAKIP